MLTAADVAAHLDALAKPKGSLGELERIAARLAVASGCLAPVTRPRTLLLFAADHGVVADGVSAWPQAVTTAMIRLIADGRAVSSALARAHDCRLRLIDVGSAGPVDGPWPPHVRIARVGQGTASLARSPAMSVEAFDAALAIGMAEAEAAIAEGARLILTGEMGIGNTTAAAALVALLTGTPAAQATGPGAGADDAMLERKKAIVAAAVARAEPLLQSKPRAAMAEVAGFEIVAMAGATLAAGRLGVPVLLDGLVSTAAALIAARLAPAIQPHLLAAHRSAEPGHGHALAALGLAPILDWGMRLGEGSGALVALPLLDSAAALLADVARLADVTG
ncbi:nicotinate-nucleotide--dimethylbenzimidazole phosphoribosyltransferase [Thermaurantiacus sp.]